MTSLSTKANRLYPSLPNIDESLDSHTAALQAVKDSIQTHERQDGNYLKSFIRFEELIDLGIIDKDGVFVLNVDLETGDSLVTLGDLSDVTLTSPGDNAILGYDTVTAEWIDQSAAQLGLSVVGHTHPVSEIPDIALNDLTDVDLGGAHAYDLLFRNTDGDWRPTEQLLQWDGADLHLPLGDLRFYAVGDSVSSALRQNFRAAGDVMLQVPGGNIYLQPGLDVFLDGATNLVVESDQYIQWLNEAGAKIDLLHFAPLAGGGAEVGHIIKKLQTAVSTTSGTYVDVTNAVITFAELDANEDYVVFVRAYVGADGGNTPLNGIQLTKDGTLVSGSENLYEPPFGLVGNLHGMLYYWGGVIDWGSSGDLQLQMKSGNGGVDTAFADKVTLMAIKVSDLALGTNVFHDTDTSLVEIDQGGQDPDWLGVGASVTIGDGVSDYLVFGSMQVEDFLSGSNNAGVRVSDGTNAQIGTYMALGDLSDTLALGFCQLWKAPAASTTLQVQAQCAFFPADKKYASIIAIRLSALANYQGTYLDASGLFIGPPRDVINLNFFVAATATDYCLMMCGTGSTGSASDSPDPMLLLDLNSVGDVILAGTEGENFTASGAYHGPHPHWLVSDDQSWTSGDDIDAAFNVITGSSGSAEWFDNFFVTFQWKLWAAEEFFDVGNAGYVTNHKGQSSRFYNVGFTDYVQFDHDGGDFNISGFQTADINITGITSIQAGTVDVDFDDITATTYGAILEGNLVDKSVQEEIETYWTWNSTQPNIRFNQTDAAANNRLWELGADNEQFTLTLWNDAQTQLIDVFRVDRTGQVADNFDFLCPVRIFDSTGADSLAMAHGGTNFTFTFTNTALVRFSGLSDGLYIPGNLVVEDGKNFTIQDAANNDGMIQSHDGTDFNWQGINTADWNITGITALNAGAMDADFDVLTATTIVTDGAGDSSFVGNVGIGTSNPQKNLHIESTVPTIRLSDSNP
ncbi:hypothetical protein LCGC14_1328440, partial [marine sediment metagenome]